MPEVVTFADELPMVPKANKVSLKMVNDELKEVKNKLEVRFWNPSPCSGIKGAGDRPQGGGGSTTVGRQFSLFRC